MPVAVEELRLGRYRAMEFDQGAASWAIVLPGAGYSDIGDPAISIAPPP